MKVDLKNFIETEAQNGSKIAALNDQVQNLNR
jgi:hypothetical protein